MRCILCPRWRRFSGLLDPTHMHLNGHDVDDEAGGTTLTQMTPYVLCTDSHCSFFTLGARPSGNYCTSDGQICDFSLDWPPRPRVGNRNSQRNQYIMVHTHDAYIYFALLCIYGLVWGSSDQATRQRPLREGEGEREKRSTC